jgi:hypothetical protein
MPIAAMDVSSVNERDVLARPHRLLASTANSRRHLLTVLLVPAPLQFAKGEALGLRTTSPTAEFTMSSAFLVLIAPPYWAQPKSISGRDGFLAAATARANQVGRNLLIRRGVTTVATDIFGMATGK